MDIVCYIGRYGPKPEVPSLPWILHGTSVQDYFSHHSASGISLTLNPDRLPMDIVRGDATPYADPYRLNKALNVLIGNSDATAPNLTPNTVGLLFADHCRTIDGLYGLMFNAPFYVNETPFKNTYRQGAAVFIDEIRNNRKDKDFLGQVMFDVIHELGHVFNLWHTPNNPPSFMTPSNSKSLYPPESFHFSDEQTVFLSQWSQGSNAKYVAPGQSPFGCRGGYIVPQDDKGEDHPLKDVLHLTINMTQQEFWSFEPVELDIRLEVDQMCHTNAEVAIPNEVDPGYERFRIAITEPTGATRLYNPPELYCGNNRQLVIRKGHPFVRDITLFGQSGGYTFPEKGRYQIQALFRIGTAEVRSNVIEVSILEPAERDRFYRTASRVFRDPSIAEALFYRHAPRDTRLLLPALEIGKAHKSNGAVAGFHYALGRGLLNRAKDMTTAVNKKKDLQAGLDYLSRALDSNKLFGHRATIAQEFIQS